MSWGREWGKHHEPEMEELVAVMVRKGEIWEAGDRLTVTHEW